MNNQLYEQDLNLWRESIIEQIKQHRNIVLWETWWCWDTVRVCDNFLA
ncbi:hypothetical protein [Nostoc sp.]